MLKSTSRSQILIICICLAVFLPGCRKKSPPKIPDIIAPAGSVRINNGADCTNSTTVTLNLLAQDNPGGDGLSQMRFSSDKVTWAAAEVYSATKTWTLSGGDGAKTVYAQFSDKAGNWSLACSDTIILDTAPPLLGISSPSEGEVIG